MTFYKTLATAEQDGKTITAYEKTEKYSTAKQYVITVARDSIAIEEIKTARTTWRKKFAELTN